MISPATTDDAEHASELLRAVYEGGLFTSAHVRYRMETADPDERAAWWKVEDGRRIVAWATAALATLSAEPGAAFASVSVHPEARRSGLGTALWDTVSAHLHEIGARKASIASCDDDPSTGFARKRGLRHTTTDTLLVVDPGRIESEPAPADVEIRPLSAFLDDPKPVYRCESETTQDEPGPFDFTAMTLERWRTHVWDHPDVDRDLSLAALVDGEVVGTTFLCTDPQTKRGLNAGTGVLRAFRGRGLGLLLKRQSLSRAAAAGIAQVATHNDDTNTPMLAINRRLGYRPLSTSHWWVHEPGDRGAG